MHPFECIKKACGDLIKYKGLQILVEQMAVDCPEPYLNRLDYYVTIRLSYNFSIDLIFTADDFKPNKPWEIEDDIRLAGLNEDDKQVARFMYFFWKLNDYMLHPRPDYTPLADFIFKRTRNIRRTL